MNNNVDPDKFCKFLKHGIVYNNDATEFTISPCCYFKKNYQISVDADISAQINAYRKSWLEEDFNSTCKICLDAEFSGATSYRQASFDAVDSSKDISFVTVAVNKKCNLACPSCGPHSSSFWYQQNIRDGVSHPTKIINLHQEDRAGIITEKFVDVFKSNEFRSIDYIKFGGGEPLMSSTHLEILKLINNPEQTTVQYTSNFSIEPTKEILDIWSRFRLIKWCASVDGINEQFELLRWPYKWSNFCKFKKQAWETVPGNVMFGIEHTLNPLNVWYFADFKQWFDREFAENRLGDKSDLNLHTCFGELGLEQTPPALRAALKNRFGSNHSVVLLLEKLPYNGSYSTMVNYLDNLDYRRQTNWRNTFKEVSDYFLN